ncbi:MAG TPA: FAD-dependent oxidoreductase [Pseudonocardiaceae bacterium]|nr:FAD-dependent oxidoreductase [Pseudonocardiaceae bacterium]
MPQAKHIVVIGAGYAGLAAAKLAARWTGAEVTLVNAVEKFVERVRLHQLAAGQELRDWPLAELLAGTGVRLVIGEVAEIDPDGHTIGLADDTELAYDTLIYALGSQADLDSVTGAGQHAHTVTDLARATALRARLREGGTVAVIGGGLTGIEAAAELAESLPTVKVRLLTGGRLGAALSEKGRAHLRRTFDRLGVEVREDAVVIEVRADGVRLAGGEHVAADTVVWTTGFRVPDLARAAGFAVDEHGRMIVDDTLRSASHPDVLAIGDAAAIHRPDGLELRMACATGLPTTQHAVRALAARMSGRPVGPLKFRYVNQCISLGRKDALIQFVHNDDRPREAVLTGRFAALYKETVVRSATLFERHPTLPASF